MTTAHKYRRKLIEVDLPLDVINRQSASEKSARHGHPSTLHLWWSRKPLASCRAVIFASLVDDPSSCPDEFPTEEEQRVERERLHAIIRDLVIWKNTDESKPGARDLKDRARYEIARSVARSRGSADDAPTEPAAVLRYLADNAPPIYDPFAGGGSIPLEAQRLGMRAVASDLNPVAVLINKALIELPPKFADQPPVNPNADGLGMPVGKGRRARRVPWRGAAGLADDIRYYGRWMREKAFEKIGHLYPKAKLQDGSEATVIAWLWARTVPCPNPVCGVAMPLMTTFQLSKKKDNAHWTRPVVDRDAKTIRFEVQTSDNGIPVDRTVLNGKGALCLSCDSLVTQDYIREQSMAGNMGAQMTGIVAEGAPKRLFLSPTEEHAKVAKFAKPSWTPNQKMPSTANLVSGRGYGITHWRQLFTERQLCSLTTFSSLSSEVREQAMQDGASPEYADCVTTYIALAIGKLSNGHSSFSTWQNTGGGFVKGVFALQAIPMIWNFAEANVFSTSTQHWLSQVEWVAKTVQRLPANVNDGITYQADASETIHADKGPVIVTDPPYYDNISYAELSDFFYVWHRPILRDIYPDLFAGILAPIYEEMIAAPRFDNPRQRFEEMMGKTLNLIRERSTSEFPSSIFYAYKQRVEQRNGKTSTGWETMLNALVDAGFLIVGTWPMRTERGRRPNALNANALASSVVLVCRPRPDDAPTASRRQFLAELESDLPNRLDHLTREGHIAPVDLAQAAIGPGMEIYSRYSRVRTIEGETVSVRDALIAIDNAVQAYFEREQGELDQQSRFCFEWLQQTKSGEGDYGIADTLAKAKNIALDDMGRTLTIGAGKAKLRGLDDYSGNGETPLGIITAWEGAFRMAWHLEHEDGRGAEGAADVARAMQRAGADVDSVERLARILYDHYDRANDSRHAVMFNTLATEWQDILAEAREPQTGELL